MSIEAIAAIAAPTATLPSAPAFAAKSTEASTFSDWLGGQLSVTNTKIEKADDAVRSLALGKTDNLHQVMMDVESARLSLDLVLQVRNKVVEAYQELMRMQI